MNGDHAADKPRALVDMTPFKDDAAPSSRRQNFRCAVVAIGIFMLLFIAFRAGLVKGVQDVIADQTWGRVQFSIGSAVTSMRHGGSGYTIAGAVRTVLESFGLTGDPAILKGLGVTFPENLRNPVLINKAIKTASEAKWAFNPNGNITGNGGDDIGMVDFVRLSFTLFGFNMLSFYLTYFVLIGVSLICAVVAFRKQTGALAVFFVLSLALSLVFGSSLLNPDMDGILDPRFLSTLSIIPAVHIALTLLAKSTWTRGEGALVVLQSGILVFGIWIRSSALWMLLALIILALVLAIPILKRRQWKDLRPLWPVATVCAVAVVHLLYVALALHPLYRSANERPYHGLWHAMVYALQFHPQWKEKYAAEYDFAVYDEHPEMVAKKYLLRHPPKDPDAVYLTADRKYIRTGVVEDIKRRALLEFLATDPRFVLESYFVSNVRLCYTSLAYHLSSLRQLPGIAKLGAMLALITLAYFLLSDKLELKRFLHGNVALTMGFVVSLTYLIITAPSLQVVADQFFILLALSGGWLAFVFASTAKFFIADD